MDHFLDFYFNSISIVKNMFLQFSLVANWMITPNDQLTSILGQPISIVSLMLGTGISFYIGRVLYKFFINFF